VRGNALPARTRVAVVGGSCSRLAAALTLRRLCHEVTVLDAERIGWGACSQNSGMFAGTMLASSRLSAQARTSCIRCA